MNRNTTLGLIALLTIALLSGGVAAQWSFDVDNTEIVIGEETGYTVPDGATVESFDTGIVEVNSGTLIGVGNGNTTVRAVHNGEVKTVNMSVSTPPATALDLQIEENTVAAGNETNYTVQISYNTNMTTGLETGIESDNPDVATASDGTISTHKPGVANFTAEYQGDVMTEQVNVSRDTGAEDGDAVVDIPRDDVYNVTTFITGNTTIEEIDESIQQDLSAWDSASGVDVTGDGLTTDGYGQVSFATGGSGDVFVHNTTDGSQDKQLVNSEISQGGVWSPDGTQFAYASNLSVYIYNTNDWSLAQELTNPTKSVQQLEWSPTGDYLGYVSNDHNLYIHDTVDWSLNTTISQGDDAQTLAWSEEYVAFGTTSNSGEVYVYNYSWGHEKTLNDYSDGEAVKGITFNGNQIAYAHNNLNITIRNTTTWEMDARLQEDTNEPFYTNSLEWSGEHIVHSDFSSNVYVWNTSTWSLEKTVTTSEDTRDVTINENYLAFATWDTVHLYDKDWNQLDTIQSPDYITSVTLSGESGYAEYHYSDTYEFNESRVIWDELNQRGLSISISTDGSTYTPIQNNTWRETKTTELWVRVDLWDQGTLTELTTEYRGNESFPTTDPDLGNGVEVAGELDDGQTFRFNKAPGDWVNVSRESQVDYRIEYSYDEPRDRTISTTKNITVTNETITDFELRIGGDESIGQFPVNGTKDLSAWLIYSDGSEEEVTKETLFDTEGELAVENITELTNTGETGTTNVTADYVRNGTAFHDTQSVQVIITGLGAPGNSFIDELWLSLTSPWVLFSLLVIGSGSLLQREDLWDPGWALEVSIGGVIIVGLFSGVPIWFSIYAALLGGILLWEGSWETIRMQQQDDLEVTR